VLTEELQLCPDRPAERSDLGPRSITEPSCNGATRSPRDVVEPTAPGRYKVQFTATAELRDKLEQLRALMTGAPGGNDLAVLVEQAVPEKLDRLEARRCTFTDPRAPIVDAHAP
jgi:hypothetical protein